MAASISIGTEDEEEGPLDFLQSMMADCEDSEDDINDPASTEQNSVDMMGSEKSEEPQYNCRKPVWWKRLSRRPTKAQRRSIEAMVNFRLPKVEWGQFLDWDALFPSIGDSRNHNDNTDDKRKEVWLEIGFGTGDNLLALAQKYPHKCFVGAEVHSSGTGKLCQRMHQAILNNEYWTGYTNFSEELSNCPQEQLPEEVEIDEPVDTPLPTTSLYSNLRIYGGDGVKLLPYIPTSSLAAVLVTFPDPFPKNKHSQFRVIQTHTLMELHRILQPRGRLFLATDHEGHYQWCNEKVDQVNTQSETCHSQENADRDAAKGREEGVANKGGGESSLFSRIEDVDRKEWLPVISKYEQKGWNEGRNTHLSCWEAMK